MAETVVTAIAAQKGGTGKTALAGSLGPLWAYSGPWGPGAASRSSSPARRFRTLLVDLDQQANLTYAFAVNPAQLDTTVVDVLAPLNAVPAESAILRNVHGVPGLDLLPCDERAEALDTQLRSETMGVYKLSDALESVRGRYDRIFIDCPPNIGELTVSALLAADDIICPVNMGDINAVRGLSRLTRTVEKLNKRDAKVGFKSLVKVNSDDRENRQRLNSDALKKLAQRLDLSVARTELRSRAAWGTAVTQDVPLILLEESDRGTREAQTDIHHLARELWPEVDFLFPSEIRIERRRTQEREQAAA